MYLLWPLLVSVLSEVFKVWICWLNWIFVILFYKMRMQNFNLLMQISYSKWSPFSKLCRKRLCKQYHLAKEICFRVSWGNGANWSYIYMTVSVASFSIFNFSCFCFTKIIKENSYCWSVKCSRKRYCNLFTFL